MLTVILHSVPKTFPWPRCVHAGEFLPRSTFAHASSGPRSVRGWTSLSAPSSKLRFHWLLQALVQLWMLSLHSALLCCILGVVNDAPSILFGGQGDGSKTTLLLLLNFSVVDLNQLTFCATLQLGYLCLSHKWFIWPWPLWILSSLRLLSVNLWEGATCPAGIADLLFWGLCRKPADCPKRTSGAILCNPSAEREQDGVCKWKQSGKTSCFHVHALHAEDRKVLVLNWNQLEVSSLKQSDLSQRACKLKVTSVNQAAGGEFVLPGHPQLGNSCQ